MRKHCIGRPSPRPPLVCERGIMGMHPRGCGHNCLQSWQLLTPAGLAHHPSTSRLPGALARPGYGDYAPTLLASQAMLIAMLAITFTLLPHQSGALLAALSATNRYQRAAYRAAACGRHVLVTGGAALDASRVQRLTSELYAADYGGCVGCSTAATCAIVLARRTPCGRPRPRNAHQRAQLTTAGMTGHRCPLP